MISDDTNYDVPCDADENEDEIIVIDPETGERIDAEYVDEAEDAAEADPVATDVLTKNSDDDDDDWMDDPEPGDDDPFLSQIFANLMLHYKPTHAYDNIVREIVGRLSDNVYHRPWIVEYAVQLDEYRKNHPENKFALPREAFTQDEIIDFAKVANSKLNLSELPISNNARVLADILELSPVETVFLQLAVKLSSNLPYTFHGLFEQFRYSDLGENQAKLFSQMFAVSEDEIRAALKGFLFQSGLLNNATESRHKPFYYINADMREAFCAPHVSAETLTTHLFPSNMKTELTLDDYAHLAVEIKRVEQIIGASLTSNDRGTNLMFWGIPGTGKTELALLMAKVNGWNLRIIGDISDADNKEKSRAERLVSLKIALKLYGRDTNTVLLFDEMEDLFKTDMNAAFSKAFINRVIETTTVPIIWTTNALLSADRSYLRRMIYNIAFEVPPVTARRSMWQRYTDQYKIDLESDVLDDLAETYDTAPSLIHNAVKIAAMAKLDSNDVPEIVQSLDRLVNFGEKRKFAERVKLDTTYDLSCINTEQNIESLSDCLCTALPTFSLLLYGPPGTGKSEYGRYITKRMNRRFMSRKASDLLGMFVGETEKRIAEAFEEAKKNEAVLLIDEGDTFLRNRENARQSWEVSQVNEMLAQMERHTYPFILTTNLMDSLDAAAMRRFTFKMKFNFMRPEQSARLFERFFGQEAPKAIESMKILTPGDYAAVRKRATVIGETDAQKLLDMLAEECAVKPQFSTKIGF